MSAPTSNPAEFRAWLLEDPTRSTAWVDDILKPSEVVDEYPHLAGSVQTLANWRHASKGPRYLDLSTGIHYRRLDILSYLETKLVDPNTARKRRMKLAV